MKNGMVAAGIVALVALWSCTAAELGKVRDASDRRETICAFASAWAETPELAKVKRACEAGESLKKIAAAYAGCVPNE